MKVYVIGQSFEVERNSLYTKNRNICCYQTSNLLKTLFFFLRCKEGKKKIKMNLSLNLQEFQLRLFSCKNISQIASKTFATQCFFTDYLIRKSVSKTICRTPSANPCQLRTYQLKSFQTAMFPKSNINKTDSFQFR